MMMTQSTLPYQYQLEKNSSGLMGFAGLPLYIELANKSGLTQTIIKSLRTNTQGWTDSELILSLMLINLAGGDCISDIDRLERDAGLRLLLLRFATHGMRHKERRAFEKRWRKSKERALPSNAAIHRYLRHFHSPEEEKKRVVGEAFIPTPNAKLKSLMDLNQTLIDFIQQQSPVRQATLDQDATLTQTYKRSAYYSYKHYKAYQPLNTYWAEQGVVLHSEFRDGNVPAGYEQLRVFQEALRLLPQEISQVFLRSDSAGYQTELLDYCAEGNDPRFGVIEFAIASKVSGAFKAAVNELKPDAWQVFYKDCADGTRIPTSQEWAEVCFVPGWAATSKNQVAYRYLAIREAMKEPPSEKALDKLALPFQTIQSNNVTYKLLGLVTNRRLEGNALIQWHRERCGKSEHIHSIQKEGLAGGQLPSNLFGVNAAWWQIMILSLNLNRMMQLVALPEYLKESHMKALRFHVIQLPARVINHARQFCIRVEHHAYELYTLIRHRIAALTIPLSLQANTS
jgi:hypothetical protein